MKNLKSLFAAVVALLFLLAGSSEVAFAARTAVVTPSAGTVNGIVYNSAGSLLNSPLLTFDGTNLTIIPIAGSIALGSTTLSTFNGNLGIASSTPNAALQVATTTSNATTSVEFGKLGQNKGTCLTFFDGAGTAVYGFIANGATSFTYTTTKPSGCQS